MSRRKSILLFLFLFTYFISGCENKNINAEYQQFNESFMRATDFVEEDRDPLVAIKYLDAKLVETELGNMQEVLHKLSINLNTVNEKGIYANLQNSYKRIEFLLGVAKRNEALTLEEKIKVGRELSFVGLDRKEIMKEER